VRASGQSQQALSIFFTCAQHDCENATQTAQKKTARKARAAFTQVWTRKKQAQPLSSCECARHVGVAPTARRVWLCGASSVRRRLSTCATCTMCTMYTVCTISMSEKPRRGGVRCSTEVPPSQRHGTRAARAPDSARFCCVDSPHVRIACLCRAPPSYACGSPPVARTSEYQAHLRQYPSVTSAWTRSSSRAIRAVASTRCACTFFHHAHRQVVPESANIALAIRGPGTRGAPKSRSNRRNMQTSTAAAWYGFRS
jgi:hypothetical protein